MRTAVYNRHWATGGGAEKYGGVIAQVLSADGPLDLLTHEPVDVDWLAERLHLDLSRVDVRMVEDEPGSVTKASADYDLFVNVSYRSVDAAATARSLYVVHFPSPVEPVLSPVAALAAWHTRGLRRSLFPGELEWEDGFHPRDPETRSVAWTNGAAVLRFTAPPGRSTQVTLVFGRQLPPSFGPVPVRIEQDGRTVVETTLRPPRSRLASRMGRWRNTLTIDVAGEDQARPVELRVVSDTFVPADVLGSDDRRRLGVPVEAVRIGTGPWGRVLGRLPVVLDAPASSVWTGSYGAMVSNSAFTQGWVRRWWECDSQVLFPPVSMYTAQGKEPIVLGVGRFFDAAHGHSKKQLELVWAFRDLHDRGATGWSLHLVGGCSPSGRPYLDTVRQAAAGYPVELHVDASGEDKERLYGQAGVYWHASGLGEDPERHPERMEHFGITTAEAMSAGAVPVVVGLAGQLETVRNGVDGYHVNDLEDMVTVTQGLIGDDDRRAAMAASAQARAREFSVEAFEARLRAIVDQVRR